MIYGLPVQTAYVTSDLDRGCAALGEHYGIREFLRPDLTIGRTDYGEEMRMRLAHAWWGDTWIELIEPVDGAIGLYQNWTPAASPLRLHHLGIFVQTPDDYKEALGINRAAGRSPVFSMRRPNGTQVCYFDTVKDLGHYTEYLYFPEEAMSQILARMPRNDVVGRR